jgi:hypothetical protein
MKTKRNKPRQRFDLRRREFDGKIIKWETKRLSELGILPSLGVGHPARAVHHRRCW